MDAHFRTSSLRLHPPSPQFADKPLPSPPHSSPQLIPPPAQRSPQTTLQPQLCDQCFTPLPRHVHRFSREARFCRYCPPRYPPPPSHINGLHLNPHISPPINDEDEEAVDGIDAYHESLKGEDTLPPSLLPATNTPYHTTPLAETGYTITVQHLVSDLESTLFSLKTFIGTSQLGETSRQTQGLGGWDHVAVGYVDVSGGMRSRGRYCDDEQEDEADELDARALERGDGAIVKEKVVLGREEKMVAPLEDIGKAVKMVEGVLAGWWGKK